MTDNLHAKRIKALGPYLKLDRARIHISELEKEIHSYVAREPFSFEIKPQASGLRVGPVVIVREIIPPTWSLIIGDAIHNMRSSFDLAVNAVVDSDHFGKASVGIYAEPQVDKESGKPYPNGVPKIKGLAEATMQKITNFQPFNSGDHDLRTVHDLDRHDKHRHLVVAGNASFAQGMVGYFTQGPNAGGWIKADIPIYGTKLGEEPHQIAVSTTYGPDFKLTNRIDFKFVLADYPSLEGQDILRMLNRLHQKSKDFVDAIMLS